jgi:hypothetical protein
MTRDARALVAVLALAAALSGSAPGVRPSGAASDPAPAPAVAAETKSTRAEFKPARQLFERYDALAAAFDTTVADLFSDSAMIQNTRRYPDGTSKVMTLPAPAYKDLIRKVMPLARARDDRNTYTKVTYVAEGPNVRIAGQRTSTMKKYTSPFSLLVGADEKGKWLILEEITESQP